MVAVERASAAAVARLVGFALPFFFDVSDLIEAGLGERPQPLEVELAIGHLLQEPELRLRERLAALDAEDQLGFDLLGELGSITSNSITS